MTWLILVAASAFSSGAATAWERAIRPEMAACLGPVTAATSRWRQHHATGTSGTRIPQPPNLRSPTPEGPGSGWDRADTVRHLHWLDSRLDHLEALVADPDAVINAANQAASGAAVQVEGTG